AIVGAGAVGASAAYALALSGTCHEIILYDIMPEIAVGKAIDIAQATNYSPRGTIVKAAMKPEDIKNCDVVVITAGVPRKKEMTRADLLNINAGIVKEVSENVKKYSPNATILCVSNPLDVMTYVVQKITGWDRHRIVGMSGALDGSRMAYQIYQKTGFGAAQTRAIVIGEHGEHMIPYPEITNVGGVPLTQLLSQEDIDDIVEKTKNGGAEIVKHLKTSAFYAPGRAISAMIESILSDEDKVISSCAILDGEYGYKDVAIGVPCVLGATGIKKIIELDFDEKTKAKFDEAVSAIKENIAILRDGGFFDK
ncbi:MAG: malate dehydrogenase, partial [Epsilonproteobacteria bacterium]|nr:malate dehydrogenase [Campylobacterota bacterium]